MLITFSLVHLFVAFRNINNVYLIKNSKVTKHQVLSGTTIYTSLYTHHTIVVYTYTIADKNSSGVEICYVPHFSAS